MTFTGAYDRSRFKFHYEAVLGKMLQPEATGPFDRERPYLRAANVLDGTVETENLKTMWFSRSEVAKYELKPGDLLVLEGGDVGRCAIWNGGLDDVGFQNSVHRVRPLPENSNRFAAYWLKHLKSTGYFDLVCSRATLAHFTVEKVKETPFPRVCISTQEHIVTFLDRETTRIDQLIEKKLYLLALLSEKRKALCSWVVTRGLDNHAELRATDSPFVPFIPAHWTLPRLKQLASVRGGITLGRSLPPGAETIEVPYLRVANVQAGWVDLSDVATLSVLRSELTRYRLQKGDVLMNEGGDNDKLGRGVVWDAQIDPCLHQNHVFAVRPKDPQLGEWIALSSSAQYGRDFFFLNSKQSTNLASIAKSKVEQFPIPLPPDQERASLVQHVHRLVKAGKDAELKVQKSIDLLRELRSALITAAVTGQIDVETWRRRGNTDRQLDAIEKEVGA